MKRRGAQQHHRLAANICLVSYRRSARKTVAQCSHRLREAHIMQRKQGILHYVSLNKLHC